MLHKHDGGRWLKLKARKMSRKSTPENFLISFLRGCQISCREKEKASLRTRQYFVTCCIQKSASNRGKDDDEECERLNLLLCELNMKRRFCRAAGLNWDWNFPAEINRCKFILWSRNVFWESFSVFKLPEVSFENNRKFWKASIFF